MSWQSRLQAAAVRHFLRRRSWGDEETLARRARRIFGAPPLYRSLMAWGVRRNEVVEPIRGEWLSPPQPEPGVVLYIHGGGFVACSAATHRPIAAALARYTRRRVFSTEYRLAPEFRYPSAPEDVLATYLWLRSISRDGEPIVVAGDSAGGNLALGLCIHLAQHGTMPPAALILLSPWTDLGGSGASVQSNEGRDPMFHADNLAEFAAAYLGKAARDVPEASPMDGPFRGLPPTLLHVGATEILLDDSTRLHHALLEAGVTSRLRVFDDVAHGWQMLVPFLPESRESLREAGAFAVEHMTASTGTAD